MRNGRPSRNIYNQQIYPVFSEQPQKEEVEMNDSQSAGKNRKKLTVKLAMSILVSSTLIGATSNVLAQGMACDKLAGLNLPQAKVAAAEIVAKGSFQLPQTGQGGGRGPKFDPNVLPDFCRVQATLAPSADSNIKMEVWLPVSGWNGNYHTVGNGGWGGTISYQGLIESIQRGYAVASTDTGHTEPGASWAPGHPEKVKDYGGRAIHETTVKAKAITKAFYGKAPAVSFMTGCSLGGLQTIKSIQDYPEDFDAVVAGSPHINMTRWNATQIWPSWVLLKDPEKLISKEKMAYVHQKVLEQCDGSDGLKDGIVDNPLTCGFKVSSLLCKGDETPECLTKKQAEFLQQVYAGPVYQSTGKSINPGPLVGNEGNWRFSLPPNPASVATELFKYLTFEDPKWDWKSMDYDKDIQLTEKKVAPVINADNPERLARYFNRGGKLILYIGSYEDTNFTAHLGYLDKARQIAGTKKTEDLVRVFVVPGMGHCGGGIGADTFDKLGAIARWQETGKAPDALDASQVKDGTVTFTRPLCAYPKWARYDGSGDSTKAENFSCKQP
jgi:feruloyl esterase